MPGLEKIVVGVDFSESSLAAARWAANQFAPNAAVILVHAVDVPQPPGFLRGMIPPVAQLAQSALQGAHMRLDRLAHELGNDRASGLARAGRGFQVLTDVAREVGASVIVVGEHGPRPGVWDVLGSTAEQLLHTAAVPVLLVRATRIGPIRRILTALDDSALTQPALHWASFVAEQHDCALDAVHVLSLSLRGHLRLTSSEAKVEEVEASFREAARRWLRETVARAGNRGQTADVEVAVGDPPHEILAAAQRFEADLIVMGSRGASAIGRTIIGSVARAVLRGAPCPVLVVPRTG